MSEDNGIIICCELSEGKLAPVTCELLGIGRQLANEAGEVLAAVLFGSDARDLADDIIGSGADKVFVIDDDIFNNYHGELYNRAFTKLCKQEKPNVVIFGQTALGRDLAPNVAFDLDTIATLDCIALAIEKDSKLLRITKPISGGRALATYISKQNRPQIVTVRAKTMPVAEEDDSREGEVITFDPGVGPSDLKVKFIEKVKDEIEGMKLEDADVVICGGRGVGSKEGFDQLRELAQILNGAIGGSRPATDAGWIPSYCQIGLTGKLVGPNVYLGIGLSGSTQHLAGMSGSKNILAINKDPEANIFNVADYGVVGEYEKVLPAFIEKCKELV